MYAISVSMAVNPPGVKPLLTLGELWRGLEVKAEDPVPFVPGMESCKIVSRTDDGFIREVVVRGNTFQEALTFTPPVQILYKRMKGEDSGWIMNTLSEGPAGFLLTYTIALSFTGVWPGSDEEKQKGDEVLFNYANALRQTLESIRSRMAEGTL
ncbi:MAG: DUF1857 family protein [Holophagaceae bacterium]|nr:DUF1857 family protein [Holophagaceae bacterium]